MKKSRLLGAVCACFLIPSFQSANASIVLGGITFDDNAFADEVVSYTPGIIFERQLTSPFDRIVTTPEDAVLGADLASSTISMSGGEILEVAFTDNAVVNHSGNDLAIFELFGSVEFGNITINSITSSLSGISLGSIPIPGTSFSNFVNVAKVDLSDFGIGLGDSISSLSLAVTGSSSEYAAFGAIIPIPAAAWLFGSGLLGLIGIARKKAA
jgi:hypothetical protein